MAKSLMLLLALVALSVPASAEEAKVCGAPVALNDGWTLAAQAEVGLDAAKLCELNSFIAQWPEANIHAVVVVRNGKLVMERYFAGEDERWGDKLGRVTYGPEVKHDLRSISKSVDLPAGRHCAERRQISRARLPGVRRLSRLCRPAHAGEGAHHLPRSLDHVVGPGLGREPAVERSAQQRSGR